MSGEETGRPGMVMGRAGMTCPGRSLKILKGGDDERGPIGAAVHCCLRSSLRAGASGRRQILSFERVGMYHRAAGPGAAWVRFNATNGSLVGRKKRRWTEAGFERARGGRRGGGAGGRRKKKKKKKNRARRVRAEPEPSSPRTGAGRLSSSGESVRPSFRARSPCSTRRWPRLRTRMRRTRRR